jgi:hypothetical protein
MVISENSSNMRISAPQQSFFVLQIQHKSNFWWQPAGMETYIITAVALLYQTKHDNLSKLLKDDKLKQWFTPIRKIDT